MPSPSDDATIQPLLTVAELSAIFQVHPNTIWRWVSENRFPKPVRVSRKVVRFRGADLREFLRTRGAYRGRE